MQPQTTTINRSAVGYVIRLFYALGAVFLLFAVLWIGRLELGSLPGSILPVVLLYLIAVGFSALVSLYVYGLSYIDLSPTGITVHRWLTLFADDQAETPWFRVQSVESKQGGIVGELFGYGTLVIQQAGTQQPLYLTYCARSDYWADYLQRQVIATPKPVHNE